MDKNPIDCTVSMKYPLATATGQSAYGKPDHWDPFERIFGEEKDRQIGLMRPRGMTMGVLSWWAKEIFMVQVGSSRSEPARCVKLEAMCCCCDESTDSGRDAHSKTGWY